MDDAYNLIATVPKNSREVVQVALSEFKGAALIDVRVFGDYEAVDKLRATQKGVSLRIDRLPQLIEALSLAQVEAERRGLIGGES